MRPVGRPLRWGLVAVGTLVLAAGCGQGYGGQGDDGRYDGGPGEQQTGAESDLPQSSEPADLDPADLTTEIDNEYWPMEPGTQWVYRETDEEGQELRVVVTVTSETNKLANGVTARVVRDTVTQDGEVVEDTFDWYAQDSDGTIWYLGEDTAEFDDGRVTTTAGSFEAGKDGALAGVIMPAEPAVGMAYRQEYLKGEAEDNGEVLSLDEQAEVPAGHYDRALLTKDTITIEPDVLEYKLYAPGVGPVLALGISGGGGREELVEVRTVSEETTRAAGVTPLGERY
ncbi:hypothetical protein [Promicromonospora soli]|uniref:Lipoprotein n=1 Tax=Promicromonospora soli TaxID=2035533 RepID=A0A919G310_9MICO|nr:hypothetical protein [Promicromonospora soli]GHH77105.1 hypothetical protein GCM10017772_37240 [Promicromonospora soli]